MGSRLDMVDREIRRVEDEPAVHTPVLVAGKNVAAVHTSRRASAIRRGMREPQMRSDFVGRCAIRTQSHSDLRACRQT
jgi:hypothetical protein